MLTALGRLSQETRRALWKIFDIGESPLTGSSTYEQIPRVIAAEVSAVDRDRDTAQVQAWFEQGSYGYSLKGQLGHAVACLIVDGLELEGKRVFSWAVAAVDSSAMASEIRRRWSAGDVRTLVDGAVVALQEACDRDVVIDAARWGNVEPDKAKDAHVSKTAVAREGRLRTFDHLDKWVPDRVFYGVRPAVVNLLSLTLDLFPERFLELVRRLDHPVLQYHLSWRWRTGSRPEFAEAPLEWISQDASDAEIALAIWTVLGDVKSLGPLPTSAEALARPTGQHVTRSAETPANSQAAKDDVRELVKRLGALDAGRRARWIGELVGYADWALRGRHGGSKPEIVDVLERLGYDVLRRDAGSRPFEVWLQDLRSGLRAGGARRPLRHEAMLAWMVRQSQRALAGKLAASVLREYRKYTQDEERYLEIDWNDWIDRDAARSMGRALTLGHRDTDICEWVVARCQELPLSVWDAGEAIERFWNAESIANDNFLIAFMALEATEELADATPPEVSQRLAQMFWEHRRFVDQYVWKDRTNGVVTEIAARCVIRFAKPTDDWILSQANCEGAGARALWGLLDQREREHVEGNGGRSTGRQDFFVELLRIANRRFVEEEPRDLPSLEFWGHIWLHLDAVDQAETTAIEILRSRSQPLGRTLEILALRLLCLVTKARPLAVDLRGRIVPLYTGLWPNHASTPEEERQDREETRAALLAAGVLSQPGHP